MGDQRPSKAAKSDAGKTAAKPETAVQEEAAFDIDQDILKITELQAAGDIPPNAENRKAIMRLQSKIGNQAVMRMIGKAQPEQPAPTPPNLGWLMSPPKTTPNITNDEENAGEFLQREIGKAPAKEEVVEDAGGPVAGEDDNAPAAAAEQEDEGGPGAGEAPAEAAEQEDEGGSGAAEEAAGEVAGVAGLVGDYFGTGKGGPNDTDVNPLGGSTPEESYAQGGDQPVIGGSLGMGSAVVSGGFAAYNFVGNINSHRQASAELKKLKASYQGEAPEGEMPGQQELTATIALLEEQKAEAKTGAAENATDVLSSANGFLNGLATVAGWGAIGWATFAIGQFLGAIMGTVGAVRKGLEVKSRRKDAKAINEVLVGYQGELETIEGKLAELKVKNQADKESLEELDQQVDRTGIYVMRLIGQEADRSEIEQRLNTIADAINEKVNIQQAVLDNKANLKTQTTHYDTVNKTRIALTTAKRKQRAKGTGVEGGLSGLGAVGSTALLLATLGAGAAFGPIGWVVSALALTGVISYAVGMRIKRRIRKKNVERMTEEIGYISDYIKTGKLPSGGEMPDQYGAGVGPTPERRKDDLWRRKMFPTAVTKSRFMPKGTTSGRYTMQERIGIIHKYLDKYDIGTQGENAVLGIIESLKNSPDAQETMPNPAHTDELSEEHKEETPENVSLYQLNKGLLLHFFGDDAEGIEKSLTLDPADEANAGELENAKKLVKKKLKLGE